MDIGGSGVRGLCFCWYLLVGFGGYLVCLMILVACGFGLCDWCAEWVLDWCWMVVMLRAGFGWKTVGVGF